MGLLDRIFRIGKSEANALVDKMEDPIKVSEQILRELRQNYQQAIEGQAEVKAAALQHRAEEMKARERAHEWENKANGLLDMIDKGQLEPEKGNTLAEKAAESFQQAEAEAQQYATMAEKEEKAFEVLEHAVKNLKDKIDESENKVNLLKSRAKTAEVSEKINKTLSTVDTDGLTATLERMDKKVTAQEFRAEAYAEVHENNQSTEDEINKLLKASSGHSALDIIKAKRNPQKLIN